MAFSNTPQLSTYRTEQIKFDATSTLRSADNSVRRDSHIINFYYDRIKQEDVHERDVCLKKRPGITATSQSLSKTTDSHSIRGYFYEEQEDIYFWAVRDKVYKYIPNPAGSYTALIATLTTTSGDVFFDTFQKSTGEVYILFSDGTDLWSQRLRVYPDTAGAKVTDADFPTPHNPMFTVLDGYVFVSKGNTIYNSDVDTFDTWTAGNDLDCEMSSDNVRGLFRIRNYIYAIGYNSMEVFWDAANASGSPLSRYDSGYKSIGMIGGYASAGDTVYFVGQSKGDGQGVFMIDGLKVTKISDTIVERTLQSVFSTSFVNARWPIIDGAFKGHILNVDGHSFYTVVTLSEITWLYDLDHKFWYEWRSSSDMPLRIEAVWSKFNGGQYIALQNSNTIDYMSPLVYQDKSSNFTCSYTTEDNLFGSVNWKTCNRASLVADRYQTTGTSNITLQWSDDDWANSATGSATLNVFNNVPRTHRLGRFRNRSFRILYADNYPLRMKYLELELNVGAN